MARTKREFVESEALKDLAEQIINKYEFLDHIDVDKMYFAFCTDPSTEKAKPLIMGNISNELAQKVAHSKYQIAFYLDKWQNWDEETQLIMLFKALYGISEDFDGKLRKLDITDPYVILKTFGLDWTFRDDLPNIFIDPVNFQFPPNEVDDDGPDPIRPDHLVEDIMSEIDREREHRGS